MNIQCKHAALAVQIQEGWPAATWKPAERSLNNPFFGEQLLDDERDGASLQPRDAREIGARDRLTGANLVEDEVAIDLPRNFLALSICELPQAREIETWGIRY